MTDQATTETGSTQAAQTTTSRVGRWTRIALPLVIVAAIAGVGGYGYATHKSGEQMASAEGMQAPQAQANGADFAGPVPVAYAPGYYYGPDYYGYNRGYGYGNGRGYGRGNGHASGNFGFNMGGSSNVDGAADGNGYGDNGWRGGNGWY